MKNAGAIQRFSFATLTESHNKNILTSQYKNLSINNPFYLLFVEKKG